MFSIIVFKKSDDVTIVVADKIRVEIPKDMVIVTFSGKRISGLIDTNIDGEYFVLKPNMCITYNMEERQRYLCVEASIAHFVVRKIEHRETVLDDYDFD